MLAKYENLPISSLIVDPAYQRDVNQKKIKAWSREFDESLLGTIEVARRSNGTYAILDGQHRWHLLKAKNYRTVPCLVHPEMTIEEEALKFKELNCNVNRLTVLEKFWALVGANDPKHVEILRLTQKYGLKIARRTGARESMPDQIAAVGRVLLIEKTYGMDTLDSTLSFVLMVWPGNEYALKGQVLEGVAMFLHRHKGDRNFNLKAARKKLGELNTDVVLARAREKFKLYGTNIQCNIAELLTAAYNKGLTQAKKLRWREA